MPHTHTHTARPLHVGCKFNLTQNDRLYIYILFYSDANSRRMNINISAVNIRGNCEKCKGQNFSVLIVDIVKMSKLVKIHFILQYKSTETDFKNGSSYCLHHD